MVAQAFLPVRVSPLACSRAARPSAPGFLSLLFVIPNPVARFAHGKRVQKGCRANEGEGSAFCFPTFNVPTALFPPPTTGSYRECRVTLREYPTRGKGGAVRDFG